MKLLLSSLAVLCALIFSQSVLAYDLKGYKNATKSTDKTVQSINKPSTQEEGGYCECNCVNERWVCTPPDGGCQLSGACGGAIESNPVPLNSRTIPAISQPSVTQPSREIDPRSIPDDKFDPRSLPGDQFKK